MSVACCVYCIAFLHLHYKNKYSKNPSNGRNKFDDFIVLLIETEIMIEKRHNDNGHYETMGDLDNHPKPSSHSAVSYFGRSLSLRVCVCVWTNECVNIDYWISYSKLNLHITRKSLRSIQSLEASNVSQCCGFYLAKWPKPQNIHLNKNVQCFMLKMTNVLTISTVRPV